MLLSAAVTAATVQQAPQVTSPPQDPQTRGVAAHAATDAAASQLAPVAPSQDQQVAEAKALDANPPDAKAPATDAPPALPAGDAADAGIAAVPSHAVGMRGVMFRVTPPQPALLPAEAMQATESSPSTASPGDPASTAAPAVPIPELQRPRASYLLATIHFGTPEEQGIDYAELERTLAEVDTFVNEANLDEPWKPEYDGYRWLPPESPLSVMVGKDGFEKARALLPAVRPQDLDRMKPWSVLALLEARGESGGEATMDARLQRIAAGSGKRMLHLESLQEQLQALDCVPANEHVRVLDERLRASWILRIESAQAMAWYRARNLEAWLADIDRMEGLSEEARAIEQRARRCLLEDRNARWIGQLETLFQEGPALVAVGAVHLVGTEGLLAALRRDGYLVEALPL